MRDDTKHATEGKATRQLVLPTSEVNDDIHLTVKEEVRIQKTLKESTLVRIKFVFEKTSAKEKMVSAKNPSKPFSTWVTSK